MEHLGETPSPIKIIVIIVSSYSYNINTRLKELAKVNIEEQSAYTSEDGVRECGCVPGLTVQLYW